MLFDLAGAEHADRDAAGLALGGGHAHQRHGDLAVRRAAGFRPARRTTARSATGSSSRTRSNPPVTVPVGDGRAVDLVDRPGPAGIASETSRARPCCTSTRTTDEIVDTSSPRPIDRRDARAKAQRLFGAAIVGLALPRKRQRLVGAAERRPSAFRGRFRSLADESAGDRQIDAASWQRQRRARHRRGRRRQRDRLGAGSGGQRQGDLERQHRRGPVRDSTTCAGGPSISGTGWPSRRASRTISPAGIGTFTQPSRNTSTVSSARPGDRHLPRRSRGVEQRSS